MVSNSDTSSMKKLEVAFMDIFNSLTTLCIVITYSHDSLPRET
jgi:hypothetical protein